MRDKYTIALVRGAFLNEYETQNFRLRTIDKRFRIVGISSKNPISAQVGFPVIKLLSLSDLGFCRRIPRFLLNRSIGGCQFLFGLSKTVSKFDIIHTADPHYLYTFQLAKLRKAGVIKKLISTSWEIIPFNNESTLIKRHNKYFAIKHIDLFLVYTRMARKALEKEGVSPKRIKMLHLGVDTKRFHPAPVVSKDSKKNIRILFIGRFVEDKGIYDLGKVYNLLLSKYSKDFVNKSIELIMIGDGRGKNRMKLYFHENNIKNVTFKKVSYKDIHKEYQRADIFILLSRSSKRWSEQYGMVLLEAMSSGLPVVAYKSGAIGEIVGKAGVLVKEGDLNNTVLMLKSLILDDNLRYRLGKLARKRAIKYFNSETTAKEIVKIYESLV